jgi:hypothetical protein
MTVIEFKSSNTEIAFCYVDNMHTYRNAWTVELIKNQADHTISNLYTKGFSVYQGLDENILLKRVSDLKYKFAVVFSTGTEFLNGLKFFNAVENLIDQKFFIAGHVLDRKDAYYELHHQCYIINLEIYQKLNFPNIGKQELGSMHQQTVPQRSQDNWHDDYTPKTISQGTTIRDYNHKCHGWNILSIAFKENLPVIVFNESLRNNKKHFYPESKDDFNKQLEWAYYRNNYCLQQFVHTENTEYIAIDKTLKFTQIITPASGTWWIDYIDTTTSVTVIFYDYNIQSLEYWKKNSPVLDNVTYKFVYCDLLGTADFIEHLDPLASTVVNLSNIFNYEGTAFFYSLEYRLNKENQLIDRIKNLLPDAVINFTLRAATGFINTDSTRCIGLDELQKPTWHINSDWL